MLAFVHYKRTPNLGDQMCAPYHYFPFPKHESYHLGDTVPPCDAVIFGGGAIEPMIRTDGLHKKIEAKARIGWGIGSSRKGRTAHEPLIDDLDLCGVREYGREFGQARTVYVPCVSCMAPAFDKHYAVEHETVFYLHGKFDFPLQVEGPTLNNRAKNLDEAIAFLASGDTIVTNSFHGTYWGILLGKKVVCLPFSSKFYGFKFPPSYCLDGDWKKAKRAAKRYTGALPDSRAANLHFYEMVRSLIAEKKGGAHRAIYLIGANLRKLRNAVVTI